ncbi:MAG: hypothetical protein HKO07_04090, partial [Pseudomonadales bacterium]|nr:hypothetical protein [Pseudomonadales bacterium]
MKTNPVSAQLAHSGGRHSHWLLLAAALAAKLLQRRPSAPQWLFIIALLYAVGLVSGMLLFTARVEQAIYRENAALLAADLRVESSRPIEAASLVNWRALASDYGLAQLH